METGRTTSTNGEGFLSRMALNDNKAGMEGLDRDKINKIIMESSKVTSEGTSINLCMVYSVEGYSAIVHRNPYKKTHIQLRHRKVF